MGKVLLATWTKSSNIGTSLQSLALYKIISRRHDCTLLVERRYYPLRGLLPELKRVKKQRAEKSRGGAKSASYGCFDGINCVNLNSKKELKYILRNFDAYVAGSDQIWNPYFLRKTYLLDFVPDGRKKISYASSIGVDEIPKKDAKIYRRYLKGFGYISMREKSGAEYMSKLIGREIETVLDPTLLLTADEWRGFCCKAAFEYSLPKRFVLCYFVGGSGAFKEDIAAVSKKLDLPAVFINCGKGEGRQNAVSAAPDQFVKLVDEADFVCTDSFHMCAFCINFNKQFAAFDRFKNYDNGGAAGRISGLFAAFGIDAFYGGNIKNIDYAPVNCVLKSERDRCINKLFEEIEKQT